jgi:hypothetical protein
LYEERERGILAKRGEKVTIDKEGKSHAETFGNTDELQKNIKTEDWNHYVVEVEGPHMRHTINDKLMSETFDHDAKNAAKSGILALQVHAGPPMTVRFKNFSLEKPGAAAKAAAAKQKASSR